MVRNNRHMSCENICLAFPWYGFVTPVIPMDLSDCHPDCDRLLQLEHHLSTLAAILLPGDANQRECWADPSPNHVPTHKAAHVHWRPIHLRIESHQHIDNWRQHRYWGNQWWRLAAWVSDRESVHILSSGVTRIVRSLHIPCSKTQQGFCSVQHCSTIPWTHNV